VPRKILALFAVVLLLPGLAVAVEPNRYAGKPAQRVDKEILAMRLRAATRNRHGQGIEKSKSDREDGDVKSFPHFSSSFTVGGRNAFTGQTFPFTMVGFPPQSGRTANIRSVIVPLRMNFVFFGRGLDRVFEPTRAVNNIVASPLFHDAQFVNGLGQFVDQMQRATFWNKMDPRHRWHVIMDRPRIARPVTIEVTPEIGTLIQISDDPSDLVGEILFDAMDSQIHTILQFMDLKPDELPIFVTDSVFNEALGYHDAFAVQNEDRTETLQTFLYTSWFSAEQLGDLLADVSTLNHEMSEWANDPFVNNIVPSWLYPPGDDPRAECSFNPFLRTGHPQGTGPAFDDFPPVVVPLNGFKYHLQQLVMLPWFADESPSSALNGWYTFPDPSSLREPAVYCQ
jgi:hypothetical protein